MLTRYFTKFPARLLWLCLPALLCLGAGSLQSSASQGFGDGRDTALSEPLSTEALPTAAEESADDEPLIVSLTLIRVTHTSPQLVLSRYSHDSSTPHAPFSARAPPHQAAPTTAKYNTYVF